MTALSLMEQLSILLFCGKFPADHASRQFPLLASTRYRPKRDPRLRPPLAEAGIVEHARIAPVNRQIPRAREDRARLQSVEPADRMAEMRRVGVADILREVRQIDVLVDEMQQMPLPLPGAEGAKRYAGLLLEQMQEPGWRQIDRCRAIGRRHLAPGEIVEAQGSAPDALIDVAVRQFLTKNQPVEFGGGKAATPLLTAQGLIGGPNSLRDLR